MFIRRLLDRWFGPSPPATPIRPLRDPFVLPTADYVAPAPGSWLLHDAAVPPTAFPPLVSSALDPALPSRQQPQPRLQCSQAAVPLAQTHDFFPLFTGQLLAHARPQKLGDRSYLTRLAHLEPDQAVVVDIETTGLAPDAAIWAVGFLYRRQGALHLHQVIAPTPQCQSGLLAYTGHVLAQFAAAVTFWGNRFDWPRLQEALQHNTSTPLPKLLRVDVASYYRARWGRRLPAYDLLFLAGAFLGDRSLTPHIYHDIATRYATYGRTRAPQVLRPVLHHNGAKLQLTAALLTHLYRADCPLPRLPWHKTADRSEATLALARQLLFDTGYVLVRPPIPTPAEAMALQRIEGCWWSFRQSLGRDRSRQEQAIYRYVRPWLVAEGVLYVTVSSVAAVQYLQAQGFESAVRELLAQMGLTNLTLRYVRPRVTDRPQPPRGPHWDVKAWLGALIPQEAPSWPPVML